jgi:hypothetical protein
MRWEEELMELYSTLGMQDCEQYIPPQPGHSTLFERHESGLETAKAADLERAVQPSLIAINGRGSCGEEGKERCLLLARAGLSSYLCRLCAMCVNPSMLGWYSHHHTR